MTALRQRVLLDECLPHDLRHAITGHDVQTARYAGVAELTNGLLISAIEGRFDVLVTMDGNLPYQQNLAGRTLAIIVLRAPSNRMNDLLPLLPELLLALGTIAPGAIKIV
jgi:hypothetical protein